MPRVGRPRRTAQSNLPVENIPIEKPKEFPNAEMESQQVYVADDGAAVEIPPPTTTKLETITESAANNEIDSGTRTAQQTDRPTDMGAGDDIVQNIFENPNETAEPTGKGEDVPNVMSAAVAAKRLRQRIPAPEEIMAAKSTAGQRHRGRPPKKVKSCPPMDTGKLLSQTANTPTNQAQEELAPLTTTTLTTTTADGIGAPTIPPEEEEIQIGPQPTAEPIPKHPRVMGPEIVEQEKTAALPIGGDETTGEPKKKVEEKIGKIPEGKGKESPGYALRSAKRQQQQQQTRMAAQSR